MNTEKKNIEDTSKFLYKIDKLFLKAVGKHKTPDKHKESFKSKVEVQIHKLE